MPPAPIAFEDGTHFHCWLVGCRDEAVTDGAYLERIISDALKQSGLRMLSAVHDNFDGGGGCSASVVLAESHVCAHTWPERNNALLLDVSVCNHSANNRSKAETCVKLIQEGTGAQHCLREEMGYLPSLREPRLPGQGVWLDAESLLVDVHTPYQHVQVVRTEAFGVTLLLDGLFQISEKDEEFYHEPLVHPAMLAAEAPGRVLVIGGGDGGAMHHVLRHKDVESCTLVEIDAEVIRVSKEYLSDVHRGCFDDPRANIVIADANDYLDAERNSQDVVILDLTDPVGPCEKLFTERFTEKVAGALRPGGFATIHLGFPLCWPESSTRCYEAVRNVMPTMFVYSAFVPLYGTVMAFALMSPEEHGPELLEALSRRLAVRGPEGLETISPETLSAMFALPPRLRRVFPGPAGVCSTVQHAMGECR